MQITGHINVQIYISVIRFTASFIKSFVSQMKSTADDIHEKMCVWYIFLIVGFFNLISHNFICR